MKFYNFLQRFFVSTDIPCFHWSQHGQLLILKTTKDFLLKRSSSNAYPYIFSYFSKSSVKTSAKFNHFKDLALKVYLKLCYLWTLTCAHIIIFSLYFKKHAAHWLLPDFCFNWVWGKDIKYIDTNIKEIVE